jgi:large subunit ribosomal protein L34
MGIKVPVETRGRFDPVSRQHVAYGRLICQPCPCVPALSVVGAPLSTIGVVKLTKRTFQPNNRRRAKTHGFRVRMRTRAGRAIISARRRKGRAELTA